MSTTLDDAKFKRLSDLIKDSFRVRKNQKPLYVDVGNNLNRVRASQHQVIFGRRGSGKSCLLVHFLNSSASKDVLRIYVQADEIKRLTYPDILIRLLIEIFESVPVKWKPIKRLFRRKIPTQQYAGELRRLLDMALEAHVQEGASKSSQRSLGAHISNNRVGKVSAKSNSEQAEERTSVFTEQKLDTVERHLPDYKRALVNSLRNSGKPTAFIVIDDFYLIPLDRQPDVLDYLHRFARDTDYYLKIATIRHRSNLMRNEPQTVGVEIAQDVEEISLDKTLEDLSSTSEFLAQMLDRMAQKVGINNIIGNNLNPEALQEMVLCSGGVPRDFLNIFVNALESSLSAGKTKWLTPTFIHKGAGRLTYQTKIKNLKEDAGSDAVGLESVFADLLHFCLLEKKKTAFLISQDEVRNHPEEHEVIHQLMDFKLIHVVEPDTSAASGRPGRYEAYTLDFSLFMEPRKRNIEIVKFWEIDDNRRRIGIREAPTYSLERLGQVFTMPSTDNEVETVMQRLEQVESSENEPPQQKLFESMQDEKLGSA